MISVMPDAVGVAPTLQAVSGLFSPAELVWLAVFGAVPLVLGVLGWALSGRREEMISRQSREAEDARTPGGAR